MVPPIPLPPAAINTRRWRTSIAGTVKAAVNRVSSRSRMSSLLDLIAMTGQTGSKVNVGKSYKAEQFM
jgi:hypothetical protein